jgi:hypothetical protein
MSMEKAKSKVPKVSIEPEGQQAVSHLSRRSFLSRLGATGAAAATAGPLLGHAQPQSSSTQPEQASVANAGTIPISLRVNGQEHKMRIDPRATLLDCLRETLHLREPRRAATTANVVLALCTSMTGGSILV